ncbi:hypothetical protein LXL04_005437 [Taraxacum kok-saghyz]
MADRQFIDNTCKGTPYDNLCLSILLPDLKSQNTDLTSLALIAVNAVKNRGIQTQQQIQALKNSRPEFTATLVKCAEMYNALVTVDVPLSINALNGGDPKFAEGGMADSNLESLACERSF